jgi:hypothetical protein
MTTIIAGKTQFSGELKHYEFTADTASFEFYINRAVDMGATLRVEMPVPNPSMVEAITKSGLRGIANSTIDFNHNRIKVGSLGATKHFVRTETITPKGTLL